MSVFSSLRYAAARMLLKAARVDSHALPVVSQWIKQAWLVPSFENLTREGYQKSSVVTACVQAYTFTIAEPPLMVWDGEDDDATRLPKHPLRRLLRRPNPNMAEDKMWQWTAAYAAIGGTAYWVASLNAAGRPVEIYPYHIGQVRALPGGPTWIRGYEFRNDQGDWVPIDPNEYVVIDFTWPLPDFEQPWQAQTPLKSAARGVDTDGEIDRFIFALLHNDAVARTLIRLGEHQEMTAEEKDRFRGRWMEMFSGARRGGVGILDNGMEVERIGLTLEELAFDALRKVPESRIAASFRVPPIFAGLLVGLEHATYSNSAQARQQFTQDALVPLWRAWAAQVENRLGGLFGSEVFVRHDLNNVAALQEDTNAKWSRFSRAWNDGAITMNEYRRGIGQSDQPNGDFYMLDPNKRPVLASQMTLALERPEPAALPDNGGNDDASNQV